MPFSGLIGAGAAESLQQLLAKQELARQLALKEQQQQFDNQFATRRQDFAEAESGREAEQFQQSRRDRSNLAGMEQMNIDRENFEQEEAQRSLGTRLERIGQDPNIPDEVKALISLDPKNLQRVDAGDMKSAAARAREQQEADDRELGMFGAKEAIKSRFDRTAAQPKPNRHAHVINGKLVYLTEDEVNQMGGVDPTQRQRPVTGAERQTLAFYQRAEQGDQIARSLEGEIANMSLAGQARLQYAPNFIQSGENQAYRQAQRAFTEARLRKESGAAIPPAEYENDTVTYFAQPGDAPEIIAQKQEARKTLLEGLANATGAAWEEYHGAPRERAPQSQRGVGALAMVPSHGQTQGGGMVQYVRDPGTGRLVRK